MNDIFDDIHLLLKNLDYNKVLEKLFNNKRQTIKSPYDYDLNHSWYIVGDIFYKQNSFLPAIDAFEKALIDEPNDIEASLALSNSYSEVDKPEKSIDVLERALLIDSNNETLIYNLGNAWFDQGKYSIAIEEYKKIKRDKTLYSLSKSNIEACKYRINKHKSEQPIK